jgi:hypothetical protein
LGIGDWEFVIGIVFQKYGIKCDGIHKKLTIACE